MPQEDHGGSEVNHPEEVVWVMFPASDDATRVVKPSKQAFDLPAAAVATQRPAVLGSRAAMRAMRRDHLDAVGRRQMRVEGSLS